MYHPIPNSHRQHGEGNTEREGEEGWGVGVPAGEDHLWLRSLSCGKQSVDVKHEFKQLIKIFDRA